MLVGFFSYVVALPFMVGASHSFGIDRVLDGRRRTLAGTGFSLDRVPPSGMAMVAPTGHG